ncbi:MAG TPA: hypothetical protein DIS90_06035 [Cytophagales bacterium]|nr:hypothetical protein [Cytophagales bacterium]
MTILHDMKRNFLITGMVWLLAGHAVYGQDKQWEGDGEIGDVEIEIVRERQIVLPRANRNFEKVPPRPSEPIKPEITYQFRNLNFNVPDYQANLRPLRLKQEDIAKIYGNYISAGFGNFSSPYLEGWINTKRDKNRFLGAHLYHRSFGKGPVDDKNSASGNTEVSIFGETFGKDVSSGGFINYENRTGYFYGYAPGLEVNRDSIKQVYNVVSIGGSVSNTKPTDFNFNLDGKFSYLTDRYEAAESELGLNFDSDYKISAKSKINLASDYYLIARKDSLVDAKPRHLFRVSPSFVFAPLENLSISLGAITVLENDSIRNKSLHIYPNVSADYMLSQSVSAYASLTGDIDKVTLHSLSESNLWVNSNIAIFHTNKSLEFSGGLKGKLGNLFAFNMGLAAANLKDLYFYQNALQDRAKFNVVYDRGNTQRVNFYGELGYNKNEIFKLGLRGDYFTYSTDQQAEAWHRPTYRVNANTSFNIYQKLVIKVGLLAQGGMKALDNQTGLVVTLDPGIDLNVKADYFVSKQVSVFVKFENMLSNDYPMYLNYPVRGFQAMGGLSWSF